MTITTRTNLNLRVVANSERLFADLSEKAARSICTFLIAYQGKKSKEMADCFSSKGILSLRGDQTWMGRRVISTRLRDMFTNEPVTSRKFEIREVYLSKEKVIIELAADLTIQHDGQRTILYLCVFKLSDDSLLIDQCRFYTSSRQ